MKRFSISVWLTALLFLLFLPLFLFFLFLVAQLKISEDAALERRTLRTAVAVSQGTQHIIESMTQTLNVVSSAQELAEGNLQDFHAKTRFALKDTANFIIVVREDGQQLLNTRVPFNTELGAISDLGGLATVLSRNDIHVSGIFKGRTSEQWVFNVTKALPPRRETTARAIITTRNAQELESVFQTISLPKSWIASIVDGSGRVVVSSDRTKKSPGDLVDLPPNVDLERILSDTQQSVYIRDEGDVLTAVKVRGADWKVIVQGPVAMAQESVYDAWKILIFGSLFFAILSAVVFYLFSFYLRKSIRGIARMAKQLGTGEIVSPLASRISEIDTVAKALSDASFDRSQREDTITVVMRELAHRTKNLIAVVISMVRQSSRRANSTEEMTKTLIDRVMGLGFSIDLLTAREWGGVPISELLEKQLSNFGNIGQNICLKGPDINLRAEAVQHLGMAIHELATNAGKHGSLRNAKGRVDVSWKTFDVDGIQKLEFLWQERGGRKVKIPKDKGFGSQILERFAAMALNGVSTITYEPAGLIWSLTVPLETLTDHQSNT
ncbi:sensor histidine kinase [Ahrensia sp. 13_GOM-1096m]|uniref:sensor histidine kinase n=1 Tax=Ahrensia sp. 13_GOM-1096m TaxID=1380380 RepID=UPI00047C79B6|nr:sensor histidine kinase [Ahrensia sp. 13_GOM-1096m]